MDVNKWAKVVQAVLTALTAFLGALGGSAI